MTAAAASRLLKVKRPPREEWQVAKKFGLSRTTCGAIAAEYGLPYRSRFSNRIGTSNSVADPTPEQIAERCAEIRSRWSESEKERRASRMTHRPSLLRGTIR